MQLVSRVLSSRHALRVQMPIHMGHRVTYGANQANAATSEKVDAPGVFRVMFRFGAHPSVNLGGLNRLHGGLAGPVRTSEDGVE